jgi:hypothetical protein
VIFSSSLAMHPHLNFIRLADCATSCLLFVHSTLLALGDEPSLAAYSTENPALDYFFAKALEKRVLRFICT